MSYSPTSNGLNTSDFVVNYDDGTGSVSSSLGLTGIATNPGLLSISDIEPFSYGTRAVGSTTPHTFTVTNDGSVDVTLTAETITGEFAFAGGTFPGGGTCTTAGVIAPSDSCTVVIDYLPVTAAISNGIFTLDYNDGADPQSVTRGVTGTGADPAVLTLSEVDTFTFGDVAVGGSNAHTFTLTNGGDFSATGLTGAAFTNEYRFRDTGTFPGFGGTCTSSLSPGASCNLVVEFIPTAAGVQDDTIAVSYDDGTTTIQSVARLVTGEGQTAALLSAAPATHDFSDVALGGFAETVITITNDGVITAEGMSGGGLEAPYTYKGGAYPGGIGTCTDTLAGGASCTIEVVFAPTELGVQTDDIILSYSDGVSGTTLPVALTGNGQAPANIIVEGTNPFNYGLVVNGNDVVNTFTIRNDGDVEATDLAGAIALTGDYSFVGGAFPGGTAPTACVAAGTLAPAATCTIEVQFSPTTPGLQTNNLQVIYDNGVSAGNIADVQLDGTGVTPALLVIAGAGAHNFGTAAQGGFVENTFFVTNNGSAIATGLTEVGLTGNFENVGGAFPGG